MQLVYSAPSLLMAGHIRNVLEAHGIACVLKNEYLGGGAGELPLTECWPEVWVEERDYAEARKIVQRALTGADSGPPWQCSRCGEISEGQFSQCWRCGMERDELGDQQAT